MRFALALFTLGLVACGDGTNAPDTQGSPLLQSRWRGEVAGAGYAGTDAQVSLDFGPRDYQLRVESLAVAGRPGCRAYRTDTRVWSAGPTANTITVASTYTRTTVMVCDGGMASDPDRTETINGPAVADAIVTGAGCALEFRPDTAEVFRLRRAMTATSPGCAGQ